MIVTRFAPSPTGYLHRGHAFAALTAFRAARDAGGEFLLRIEDLDLTRSKREYETAICEDLRWLGLSWPEPVLRQSERFAAYRAAIGRLEEMGLVYPCFCTRSEVAAEIARAGEAPHGPDGPNYPGTCRHLPAQEARARMADGASYALRLDSSKAQLRVDPPSFEERGRGPLGETGIIQTNAALFGDIVIARKETPASYHLAVVVDDAYQGVTLVTRGEDLFAATHVQRVLQALLEFPRPVYAHHALICDEDGVKLSKRNFAASLRSLREAGATPATLRAQWGFF